MAENAHVSSISQHWALCTSQAVCADTHRAVGALSQTVMVRAGCGLVGQCRGLAGVEEQV
jgi:hypothetical protein